MRANEFHARIYEPGSPHPRLVRVVLDGGALVVKYDEGNELVMPLEELEIKSGPLANERVVLASQATRQAIVADDNRLLNAIHLGAPPHLRQQISKLHSHRRMLFLKRSLANVGIVAIVIPIVIVVALIALVIWLPSEESGKDSPRTEQTQEQSQDESEEESTSGSPVVSGKDTEAAPGANAYMHFVQTKIRKNWHPPKALESKRVGVIFGVKRNGSLGYVKIDKSSGVKEADQAAIDAVKRSAPFTKLPKSFPDSVDIQFTFDYNVNKH